MSNIWFTSDHHFGHLRIVQYDERPIAPKEHDKWLVDRWNKLIAPGDRVYHLGDFCLAGGDRAQKMFEQLNGKVYLVGNHFHHDYRWLPGTREKPFFGESSYTTRDGKVEITPPITTIEREKLLTMTKGEYGYLPTIVLCHYPFENWDRSHYGTWHLYGHTHQKENDMKSGVFKLNVGVSAWDYHPVSLGQIQEIMAQWGWHPHWKRFTDHGTRVER